MTLLKSFRKKVLPGIHIPHRKNTVNCPIEILPTPEKVRISMSQHIGAPCKPIVAKDDKVKVGQKIGDTEAFVSAPIHSSVSGIVIDLETKMSISGIVDTMIVIKTDGLQEISEEVKPPKIESREDFLKATREAGLVGLGGASFPTHVKFAPKNLDEVDTFIINAAECEPYITSDYQNMINDSDYIIKGIELVMKYLNIKKAYIGIETNKPDAISKYEKLTTDKPIDVVPLKAIYPKGAEKVLIYEIKGEMVGIGQLPADLGCIVSNITTISALAKYVETGMPLVSKCLTVDGSAIETPKNVLAPIGTMIFDLIEFCGGYKNIPRKVIMGGPMMGRAIFDDTSPILKNNNAILAFDRNDAVLKVKEESQCISCGRCYRHCPLGLMSTNIFKAYDKRDVEELNKLKVMSCMECGCCSFICPAGKQLSITNKMAKMLVTETEKEAKEKKAVS